jgi:hypothetical protein
MSPTKVLIRWSSTEAQRLIDDVAWHCADLGIKHIPPADDRITCQLFFSIVRAAQERQLPVDRRRKLAGRQELNDGFIQDMNRRLANPPKEKPVPFWVTDRGQPVTASGRAEPTPVTEAVRDGLLTQVPVREVTPSPAKEAVPIAEIPAKSETAHKVLVSVEPARLRSFTDEEIFSEALRRMVGIANMVEAFQKRLPTPEQLSMLANIEEMQKLLVEETGVIRKEQDRQATEMKAIAADVSKLSDAVAEAPRKDVLPRVAILGCRRYEVEHIRQGCEAVGLKLDFRHYDQDEKPRKIHADWAISLKWLSHSWDDQIKAAIPNGKYVFLNGGVGMAVNQLKTWFQV